MMWFLTKLNINKNTVPICGALNLWYLVTTWLGLFIEPILLINTQSLTTCSRALVPKKPKQITNQNSLLQIIFKSFFSYYFVFCVSIERATVIP